MEPRPPEVMDTASGENLKLACMACIRGHRTKHCGGHNCRDKILWTIKRPGRPSNSCMCKFSGTGRCKCVLAKAQCPHKSKKGEKKAVDCRCDERGRLCCTLTPPEWGHGWERGETRCEAIQKFGGASHGLFEQNGACSRPSECGTAATGTESSEHTKNPSCVCGRFHERQWR